MGFLLHESLYEKNKKASPGDVIQCATCGDKFTKAQKSQAFCTKKVRGESNCRDRFHKLIKREKRNARSTN